MELIMKSSGDTLLFSKPGSDSGEFIVHANGQVSMNTHGRNALRPDEVEDLLAATIAAMGGHRMMAMRTEFSDFEKRVHETEKRILGKP